MIKVDIAKVDSYRDVVTITVDETGFAGLVDALETAKRNSEVASIDVKVNSGGYADPFLKLAFESIKDRLAREKREAEAQERWAAKDKSIAAGTQGKTP